VDHLHIHVVPGGTVTTPSSRWWRDSVLPRRSKPRTIASRDDLVAERDDLTPMMRQYRDLKRRYPDHVLLFRLGDFYETSSRTRSSRPACCRSP